MSKRKHHTLVSTPKAARTFELASALLDDGSLEAKAKYRKLRAGTGKAYNKPVTMRQVDGYWNPEGKRQARGSSGKAERISRALGAKARTPKGVV